MQPGRQLPPGRAAPACSRTHASILSCATFKSITIRKMHSNENEIMAKLKLQ